MTKHIYWVTRYTGDPPEPYKAFLVTEETGNREPAVECCCWCWEAGDEPDGCPCYGLTINTLTVSVDCPCDDEPHWPDAYLCWDGTAEPLACVWTGGNAGPDEEGECAFILNYYPDGVPDPYAVLTVGTSTSFAYFNAEGEWDCTTALTLTCSDYCGDCEGTTATVTPGFIKS
jgi:hypothetical protein